MTNDKFRDDHTYVICAYKESPFLKECIASLKKQTVKSNIIMVTSTPNDYIKNLAEENEIPLYINTGDHGIVQDWNFGYSKAHTKYITIAHQDDVYFENYTKTALEYLDKSSHPLIFFSDYYELRNGKYIKENKLLKVKRLMLVPLRIKAFYGSIFIRRRILSFGSPICCPAVTFVRPNVPDPVFIVKYRAAEDWQAWERLSKIKGQFCYCKQAHMAHRIHEGSETSAIIADNQRSTEDFDMFCKFWPKPIARLLIKLYAKGQDSNQL